MLKCYRKVQKLDGLEILPSKVLRLLQLNFDWSSTQKGQGKVFWMLDLTHLNKITATFLSQSHPGQIHDLYIQDLFNL